MYANVGCKELNLGPRTEEQIGRYPHLKNKNQILFPMTDGDVRITNERDKMFIGKRIN